MQIKDLTQADLRREKKRIFQQNLMIDETFEATTVNKTNPQTESFVNSIIESKIGFVVASATGPRVKWFSMSIRVATVILLK